MDSTKPMTDSAAEAQSRLHHFCVPFGMQMPMIPARGGVSPVIRA
jgi:hypothetical protein